jgi:hypothetical protein
MITIEPMVPEHVLSILDGISVPMSSEDMITSYLSPGSISIAMLADGSPVACGGIINVGWHRGEAWVLTSSLSYLYSTRIVREMLRRIPEMAVRGGFRRVQATCFTAGRERFFRFLGFELETEKGLASYGPSGERAFMYAREFL